MSADNWDTCPRCATDPASAGESTFREDYEIYGADEGTIVVHYSGRCSACGLGLKFEEKRPFWNAAEGEL